MAKKAVGSVGKLNTNPPKGTSIGCRNIKTSSMNKHKKRGYKKYRGQGK